MPLWRGISVARRMPKSGAFDVELRERSARDLGRALDPARLACVEHRPRARRQADAERAATVLVAGIPDQIGPRRRRADDAAGLARTGRFYRRAPSPPRMHSSPWRPDAPLPPSPLIDPLHALARAPGTPIEAAIAAALAELDRFGVERAGISLDDDPELARAALASHPARFFARSEVDPRGGMAELRRLERLAPGPRAARRHGLARPAVPADRRQALLPGVREVRRARRRALPEPRRARGARALRAAEGRAHRRGGLASSPSCAS